MGAIPATNPSAVSHRQSLALISAVSAAGLALCVCSGWLIGGSAMALHAGAGMLAAAAGGLVAWGVLGLVAGPGAAVTAGPMLGLMVRLVVTGAGVGLLVLGLGFEKRPVLFAALFGYLVLMATESVLLYRFASSDRSGAESHPTKRVKQDP